MAIYASVNSKHQHPLGQPPGFCTYFQPGSQDLYYLNLPGDARGDARGMPGGCSGVGPIIYYQSTKLSVDAA